MKANFVLTGAIKTPIAQGKYAVAMVVAGCVGLTLPWCLGGEADAGRVAADWKTQIEADWLRQLVSRRPWWEGCAAGGCDGVKKGETTFHTKSETNPWWQVDLGKCQPLSRIEVYNTHRNPERAKNLLLLLSHDGKQWQEVYRHGGQTFGGPKDGKPLVVTLKGEPARFVRAALPTGYLHLDEVEVYGTGAPERNLALGRPAAVSSLMPKDSRALAGWKPVVRWEEEISKALERVEQLCADLRGMETAPDVSAEAAALERLRAEAQGAAALAAEAARALYFKVRWTARELALKNPLVFSRPIVFMLRHRAISNMLYEDVACYLPNRKKPDPRAGVFVLERPGRSPEVRELVSGATLKGHFATLSVSPDARTLYFAYADPEGKEAYVETGEFERAISKGLVPGHAEPGAKYYAFHIMAMDADGSNLRQLTDGPYDDFSPCPLPDGGIAFLSTRRGGQNRCGGGLTYTLHRMDADGKNLRALSYHETDEWHPSVLHDGRIVYTRWDYVDRSAANFHGLWTCNPDGSNPAVLFGNYTHRPWACYQAQAVPGSNRILFIAGGHHCAVGGPLVLLDPSRVALDPRSGEDRPEAFQELTPEVRFPEADGWSESYFFSPWPLSEKYFLTAFSHDRIGGEYAGQHPDMTGLYYFDRFGNLELLFRREGISAVYPVPLAPRPQPRVVPSTLDPGLKDEGEFALTDVYRKLSPWRADERVVELRVFQLLPKSRSTGANDPPISYQPGQENARMLLGTVPVEADGSAYFRAPARKPLYFQAVDASGRALQGMKSLVYLQPGERLGCVGCHEGPGKVPASHGGLAFRRPPSIIRPGPDGSLPFSYPRLIQPVLDRHCVKCHDGSTGPDKSPLLLTDADAPPKRFGKSDSSFSISYVNLREKGGIDILTNAADKRRKHTNVSVTVPDEDLRRVYLWCDAAVPFYGSYEEKNRAAQRRGEAVPPDALQ